tara:strand:- start:339 stop:467 length:129 start_codon:yes stop_codon:yes gene_type:complete
MQEIRTRLETAKARKALYARRRLLNSDPVPDMEWVNEMLKKL